MNKRQKLVQQQFLNDEEAVIGMLKESYGQSLKDITKKAEMLHGEIEALTSELDSIEDEDEREIQKSKIRSKVYQKKYQDSLKGQVSDILDKMQKEEFKTVSEYLDKCYEEGFVGTLYDLQGQGIPLAFPMDQEAMVRAVQLDSKISQGLYSRLGEDVSVLKKKIASDVTRGIASGMSFKQVAQQLSGKTNIGFNNAVRIARTEGHRIQCQSTMDACHKAKEKGADVVKQWDATLDAKTRDSHAQVDGEIKELDEKFSNGLMLPGDPSGGAAEVVNCRCALLQRARWAVQGGFTKMNNFTKELETFESPEDYAEFKKAFFSKENRNYMNYVQQMEDKYKTKDFRKVLDKMDDREYKHYTKLLGGNPVFNKNANGLAAKIGGKGIPQHEEPVLLKKINPSDKKEILKVLKNFEKDVIMSDVETACVITESGEVFKCFGTRNRVFPDFDLKDKLKGASVTHNHPIGETTYTFSTDDIALFEQHSLNVLRGCDEKYTYELTRDASLIDDEPEDWTNIENFHHANIIRIAKEYGIGYRRWLNE